ncbi:MAG: trigger factor [bacterium]|nr:trigger factor [bacterium]
MSTSKPVNEQNTEQLSLVELISVDIEETKSWQRVVSVALPDSEWQNACAAQLIQLRKKVSVPGFRKGKAPKEIVENQFAGQISVDALEWLLPRAWQQALHQTGGLYPIDDPEFSDIDFGDGKDFTFKATCEIKPEVQLEGYKGLKVTWYKDEVPADGLERTIESIRESRAEYVEVERAAADSDRLTADFRQVEEDGAIIEGTDVNGHEFELGSANILPEFSDGVRGLAVGEETKFPVNYPEDFEQETLAGQTRYFNVTVRKVEEKKLPEVSDEFAASLGDFENVDQLKDQIGKNINAEVDQNNRGRLEAALVQGLLAINEFEVPPSMINRYVTHMISEQEEREQKKLTDADRKQAEENFTPGAELALKRWFMLEAVSRQEKIAVSDEDFENHLQNLAAGQGEEEVEKIRESIKRSQAEGRVREDILHRKIYSYLEEQAKIKEEMVPLNQA